MGFSSGLVDSGLTAIAIDWVHHYAQINGQRTHYVEQGKGVTVILCHGFPHCWFSWHRQIPALAAAGFRVIALDMRGMGQTDAPLDISSYGVDAITADLLGLLDHIDVEKAVFIGLDFGAFAIYDFALRHPERTLAVIGLENPAAPHNPNMSPLDEYAEMAKDHFLHIEYFREVGVADHDLSNAPREFFRKVFWLLSGDGDFFDTWKHPPGTTYLDAMPEPPPLPWPWLSEIELEVYVSEYSRSGFTGGLNWYRSMDLKWQQRKAFANKQSAVPAYFLGSERDVDLEGFHGDDPISLMRDQFPGLRLVKMIPKAGHMVQLECSSQVNDILEQFLADIKQRM
ncbi:MAG: pimeloyl-ACP methyl ester carboxylesterase [Halioglobus sp.]